MKYWTESKEYIRGLESMESKNTRMESSILILGIDSLSLLESIESKEYIDIKSIYRLSYRQILEAHHDMSWLLMDSWLIALPWPNQREDSRAPVAPVPDLVDRVYHNLMDAHSAGFYSIILE